MPVRFKDLPIRKKLMNINLVIISVVLILTCVTFFTYEYFSFRERTRDKLNTLSSIIVSNSTAALAFRDQENANEILAALQAENYVSTAALFTSDSTLFAFYPSNLDPASLPSAQADTGFAFGYSFLEGFRPVSQDGRVLGALYLKYDLQAMYDRFKVYGLFCLLVIAILFIIATFLSNLLQKSISTPILTLANTVAEVSGYKDYSLRAMKFGEDELGKLTDSFNNMLSTIEKQNMEIIGFSQGLEQKVVERTAELKAANNELESFAYSVSHDLRAPLRIINGYADILTADYKNVLDDEGFRLTGIIQSNAKYMGRLIDDLLNLSRLGRAELNLETVNMNSLVESVLKEQFGETTGNTRIIREDLLPATADYNLIKQVWINLISNAVKYSSRTENAEVKIGSSANGNSVLYYVKDNGAGFDMKYVGKLFGVFQRLHKQNEFEGTGVGLAIVNRILARHEGKVWAEAEPGKGATFFFTLPSK